MTVDATGLASVYVDGFLRSSGQETGFFAAVANLDTMSIAATSTPAAASGISSVR